MDEIFDIVDDFDRVIGSASRSACHGNPLLIHRAVHVLVFTSVGKLYLQRRSEEKLIQPGRWDTSVGGHLAAAETYTTAAERETLEELGFTPENLRYLFSFEVRNSVESENIRTYYTVYDGAISPHPGEIVEGRYWDTTEIEGKLTSGIFTPAFEEEFALLKTLNVPEINTFMTA